MKAPTKEQLGFRNRSLGWFVFYLPAIRCAEANDPWEKRRIMRELSA